MQYTDDCLTRKYTAMTLGTVADTIEGNLISARQLASGSITGAKLALNFVGSGQLQNGSVGLLQIGMAAIQTAHIQTAAITSALIANAAIQTAHIGDAQITNAQIVNATIGTAQIALGAITTALIAQGAVGTAQIKDASITDAKIVELSANRITTGTLSVERLIVVGSKQSVVYTINEANGTAQLSQTTIDGGSLTERSITTDRIVAGAITANEIAAATILANNIAAGAITTDKLAAGAVTAAKIQAGAITTSHVSSSFGETLDLSSNTSVRTTVTQQVDEAIDGIEIGGVNLIDQSADHTLAADSADSYWIAADALERGKTYTFSVREVVLVEGTAAGVTWKVVEQGAGTVHTSGLLDFTYGKQVFHFTVPDAGGNWALYLYAGISGSTSDVAVQFSKSKLEEGAFATTWSPSPDDSAAAVNRISGAVEALDSGMNDRVTSLISAMGLSDRFASAEEFLNALSQIELIRSELAQHDSDLTLTFNRLTQTENSITQIFSSFVFGDEGGTPYLDMSASASSVKMRLTNTRLAFIQSGKEMAYFSDNKLYVTRLEVVEQISIGTSSNGYLDMVTTPTGVGFKWRT